MKSKNDELTDRDSNSEEYFPYDTRKYYGYTHSATNSCIPKEHQCAFIAMLQINKLSYLAERQS